MYTLEKNLYFFLFLLTIALFQTEYTHSKNLKAQSGSKTQMKTFTISLEKAPKKNKKKTHMKNKFKTGLKKYKEASFTATVYMGNPPQKVTALLDTGSSYFFVTSKFCHTNKQCKTQYYFDHTNSKSFERIEKHFSQKFASGILAGYLGRDQVMIYDNIVVQNQTVALMYEIKADDTFDNIGALIGISYPIPYANELNLFQNIINQKILKQNVIGYYINEKFGNGSVSFGYIDESHYEGKLNKVPVTGDHRWTIMIDDILIDDRPLNLCSKKMCRVMIDTGTSDMTIPSMFWDKVANYLDVSKDCKNFDEYGTFTFLINGIKYPLKRGDYIKKKESKNKGTFECKSLITKYDMTDDDVWLVGEIFLKKYYTVFDRDNDAIHFAFSK